MTDRRRGAALLLLLGTTLWGGSSAVIAEVDAAPGVAAPLVAGGGCAALVILRLVARRDRPTTLWSRENIRPYLLLGLLEAVNLGLYAAALEVGSVPVVVALHLTAPVIIVVWQVSAGQRAVTSLAGLQLVLVLGAIVAYATQDGDESTSAKIVGAALSLGSAVAVAGLIVTVARLAPGVSPAGPAAFQLGVAAVLTAPFLVLADPASGGQYLALLAGGLFLLGPGFYLYWIALRILSPSAAGLIGLNEAVAATLIALLAFGESPTGVAVVAGTLIALAVALEFISPRRVGQRDELVG